MITYVTHKVVRSLKVFSKKLSPPLLWNQIQSQSQTTVKIKAFFNLKGAFYKLFNMAESLRHHGLIVIEGGGHRKSSPEADQRRIGMLLQNSTRLHTLLDKMERGLIDPSQVAPLLRRESPFRDDPPPAA